MPHLDSRMFHSFSTIHEEGPKGWAFCMSKAYCKWPVIIGIVLAILFFFLSAYCCLRCCCGCFGGRSRKSRNRDRSNTQPSMWNPTAYMGGYQAAHNPMGGPQPVPYNQGPQYAQFDSNKGTRKITEDSLPAMPSWDTATTKRVEDFGEEHKDNVELGRLEPHIRHPMMSHANNSSVHLRSASPAAHPRSASPADPYTGPDFSTPSAAPDTSYHGAVVSPVPQKPSGYTGPDFFSQEKPYAAYTGPTAPAVAVSDVSGSTRYEPSGVNEHAGVGSQTPSALQAGRRV